MLSEEVLSTQTTENLIKSYGASHLFAAVGNHYGEVCCENAPQCGRR